LGVTVRAVDADFVICNSLNPPLLELHVQPRIREGAHIAAERLCAAVADRMIERYDPDWVTVRATKPEPPIPLPVEEVSVEVSRENH